MQGPDIFAEFKTAIQSEYDEFIDYLSKRLWKSMG